MKRASIYARLCWNATRRIIVVTFAALAVVVIGSRVNPPMEEQTPEAIIEPELNEQIADLLIDAESVERAVNSLNGHFKLPAEYWTAAGRYDGVYSQGQVKIDPQGAIHLRNTTLAKAVTKIIRRFNPELREDELGYCIKDSVLRIGPQIAMDEPILLRVYDVHNWYPPNAPDAQYIQAWAGYRNESRADAIRILVTFTVNPTVWRETGGSTDCYAEVWGNCLFVHAPAYVQSQVSRMAFLMDHPIALGAAMRGVQE